MALATVFQFLQKVGKKISWNCVFKNLHNNMRGKITYGLILLIVASVKCGLTPPDSPGDIDAFNARSDGRSGKKELNDVDCSEMNTSCKGCINLEHCYFAIENDGNTLCGDRKNAPDMEVYKDVIMDLAMCPSPTEGETTKIDPKFDPNLETTTVESTTAAASSTTTSGSENTTTTASTTTSSTTTTTASSTTVKTTQRWDFMFFLLWLRIYGI